MLEKSRSYLFVISVSLSLALLLVFALPANAQQQDPGESTTFGAICPGFPGEDPGTFIRGDFNQDGVVMLDDAISLLDALFVPGSPPPPCDDIVDIDDDGEIGIFDSIAIMNFLFVPGSDPIAAPYPNVGYDEGDACNGIDDDSDGIIDDGNENCLSFFELPVGSANIYDEVGTIIPIFDGTGAAQGYAMTGRFNDLFTYFLEIDLLGNPQPFEFISTSSSLEIYSLTQVFDGNGDADGYILAGEDNDDAWAARLDQAGNVIWDFQYPPNMDESAFFGATQARTAAGDPNGFIFIGRAFVGGAAQTYFVRIADNGAAFPPSIFGDFDQQWGFRIVPTRDATGMFDGYAIVGRAFEQGATGTTYFARSDLDGTPSIQIRYGIDGTGSSIVQSLSPTGVPEGYVIGGTIDTGATNNLMLLKINTAGGPIWLNDNGSDLTNNIGFSMIETRDATGNQTGYLACGFSLSTAPSQRVALITQYDLLGQTVHETTHLVGDDTEAFAVSQSYDPTSGEVRGGYVMAGITVESPGGAEQTDGIIASVAP